MRVTDRRGSWKGTRHIMKDRNSNSNHQKAIPQGLREHRSAKVRTNRDIRFVFSAWDAENTDYADWGRFRGLGQGGECKRFQKGESD